MNKFLTLITFFFALTHTFAQKPARTVLPPGLTSIKEQDLRRDLFELAGDSMRGRRAGTPDELKAAVWVALQAQKAGLKPGGDNGSYFQFYNLQRTKAGDNSTIEISGRRLPLWKDAWIVTPMETRIDAPVVWLNSLSDTAQDLKGKVVAMKIFPPNPLPAPGMSLWGFRYIFSAIRQQSAALRNHGAYAIILVADDQVEQSIGFAGHNYEEGQYQLEGTPASAATVPVILVSQRQGAVLQQPKAIISAALHAETFLYPSVNVIAIAAGRDARLKNEYVLFSGHHDHDGIGVPMEGDSIWNGADDNATVSVALLAIGRAWTKAAPKRSGLFVWHGAEERGLLGSRWYVQHPTVPQGSIVAVLNGDMIGRNNIDSAALLGSTSPHRNSSDLVNTALNANTTLTKFIIDSSWDSPSHPEGWYFRSDHLPYARAGIPSIFFTTLLHTDYHTPKDEPARIDLKKLFKMTQWIYLTGYQIGNASQRPRVDEGFKLER